MTLWGDAGYPGLYYPEKAVFQLGPIELTHIFEKPFAYQNLRVSDHSTFLQLDLGFPEISNGVLPSTLKIRICNRQYNIDNATMTLSSMTGLNIRLPKLISFKVIDSGMIFVYKMHVIMFCVAHADPVQKEMTLPVVNQCISLPNTTAHSRIEFHVPFTVSAEAKLVAEHKVSIVLLLLMGSLTIFNVYFIHANIFSRYSLSSDQIQNFISYTIDAATFYFHRITAS